jgi:hypothetical protein
MASPLLFDLNAKALEHQARISEDLELVAGLRAGSEQAYETLLARFQQPVYNLALRLLSDPGDASDVAGSFPESLAA